MYLHFDFDMNNQILTLEQKTSILFLRCPVKMLKSPESLSHMTQPRFARMIEKNMALLAEWIWNLIVEPYSYDSADIPFSVFNLSISQSMLN